MSRLRRDQGVCRAGLFAWILGVLLFASGATVLAAPVDRATEADKAAAREAYKDGQRKVQAHNYDGALDDFKRGYEAYEDPIFIFNIAQCHRLIGNKELAAKWYRSFLERVPNPPNLAEIQRWLAKLDAEIEADKAGRPQPKGIEPDGRAVDEKSEPTPVYKKWWLWTIVGVAVVGVALGVGLGVGLRGPPPFNQTLTDFGPGAAKTTAAVLRLQF